LRRCSPHSATTLYITAPCRTARHGAVAEPTRRRLQGQFHHRTWPTRAWIALPDGQVYDPIFHKYFDAQRYAERYAAKPEREYSKAQAIAFHCVKALRAVVRRRGDWVRVGSKALVVAAPFRTKPLECLTPRQCTRPHHACGLIRRLSGGLARGSPGSRDPHRNQAPRKHRRRVPGGHQDLTISH
jgi:hypothetical protein